MTNEEFIDYVTKLMLDDWYFSNSKEFLTINVDQDVHFIYLKVKFYNVVFNNQYVGGNIKVWYLNETIERFKKSIISKFDTLTFKDIKDINDGGMLINYYNRFYKHLHHHRMKNLKSNQLFYMRVS